MLPERAATGRSRTIAPDRVEMNELRQRMGGRPGAGVGVAHFVDFSVAAVDAGHQQLRGQVERALAQALVLADRLSLVRAETPASETTTTSVIPAG